MPDSTTPRFGLTKPEVGGSDDTWGDKLNADLDIIDANMAPVADNSGQNVSTGWLTGGALTFGTLNLTVASGTGFYVDASNQDIGTTGALVTWDGVVLPITPGSERGIWCYVSSGGVVQTQTTLPTPAEWRSRIYLGFALYNDARTLITGVTQVTNHAVRSSNLLNDLVSALGRSTIGDGVVLDPGTLLTIRHSAGFLLAVGAEPDTLADPNSVTLGAVNPITFDRLLRDGGITDTAQTSIDPNNYDLNGVLTTVPDNNATIQYLYYTPGVGYAVQYGQTAYLNLNTAKASAGDDFEHLVMWESFEHIAVLIGAIIVVQNATDLADVLQAELGAVNKGGAVGASLWPIPAVDVTYDNVTSGLEATDVQAAIDEIQDNLTSAALIALMTTDADGTELKTNGEMTVVRASEGHYVYTLTTPAPDANYQIFVLGFGSNATGDLQYKVETQSTAGFTIHIHEDGSGSRDRKHYVQAIVFADAAP